MDRKVTNKDITKLLENIATLLDIRGENHFRINAYRKAAENISLSGQDISTLVEEDRLDEIPGIGEALSQKIEEYVSTGRLRYYEDLTREVPESLLELSDVPGVGPKRVKALWDNLGITNIHDLKKAAAAKEIESIEGFGPKLQCKILESIERSEKRGMSRRHLLSDAWTVADLVIAWLKDESPVTRISAAGSLRRMQETIGDVDILVASEAPQRVMESFLAMDDIEEVIMKGGTRTSIKFRKDIQVDLRVVPEKSWGTALQYFTGSQEHNVKLRELALKKGFSLNEYALVSSKKEEEIFFSEEKDLYEYLGLQYITPELRQSGSELSLASSHVLPELVDLEDIRGDMQSHSTWSDGRDSLESMAEGAVKRGLEYLLVTDHSRGLGIARGLDGSGLKRQASEIDSINRKKRGKFKLLRGIELEIKADGSLDLDESELKGLDVVVGAIHSSLGSERKRITERYLKAMNYTQLHILAHPTGRLIDTRDEADVDWDQLFRKAADNGILLEINSSPQRLDLPDRLIRRARELGCSFVISTDAHSCDELDHMRYGVGMARRGGLTARDVANTKELGSFLSLIKKRSKK